MKRLPLGPAPGGWAYVVLSGRIQSPYRAVVIEFLSLSCCRWVDAVVLLLPPPLPPYRRGVVVSRTYYRERRPMVAPADDSGSKELYAGNALIADVSAEGTGSKPAGREPPPDINSTREGDTI
ncbi:hypothetical protein V500_10913 [Pseudogymnoascus sp. VKM F-4518 (FW-2643)]|nr:hypothetical protein V500_10913 [Pseudogymnoascus sp. VKM F-4518 (FW-2643)]